jgi:hypothetical protein
MKSLIIPIITIVFFNFNATAQHCPFDALSVIFIMLSPKVKRNLAPNTVLFYKS